MNGELILKKNVKYNDVVRDFQKKTSTIYNLEATSTESTAYLSTRIDIIRCTDIITANQEVYKNGIVSYYTNSTHLAVNFSDGIFVTPSSQGWVLNKYIEGTEFHVFTSEKNMLSTAAKYPIQKIKRRLHITCITTSSTFNICPLHGHVTGEYSKCEKFVLDYEV
ncbi:MAG TPA: anaerobic ribonucleoside-triphosphate reductase [Bacteroidales bacterium]|nr:anaerobic ribonucleoside-triphosphate reductase [Bacteroidales bacterium]